MGFCGDELYSKRSAQSGGYMERAGPCFGCRPLPRRHPRYPTLPSAGLLSSLQTWNTSPVEEGSLLSHQELPVTRLSEAGVWGPEPCTAWDEATWVQPAVILWQGRPRAAASPGCLEDPEI